MPIYDFKCKQCEKVSEVLVSGSAGDNVPTCPDCGSWDMERLISAPGLLKERHTGTDATCCGREERCETSPCSTGGQCRRRQ